MSLLLWLSEELAVSLPLGVGLEELVAVSLWLSEELMLGVSETLGVWLKLEEDVRLGVTLPLPEMLTLDDPEELGVLLSLEVGEKLALVGSETQREVSERSVRSCWPKSA